MRLGGTGRQLFERDRNLVNEDADQGEEGVTSVDITQYDRHAARADEEDEDLVHFSDSD